MIALVKYAEGRGNLELRESPRSRGRGVRRPHRGQGRGDLRIGHRLRRRGEDVHPPAAGGAGARVRGGGGGGRVEGEGLEAGRPRGLRQHRVRLRDLLLPARSGTTCSAPSGWGWATAWTAASPGTSASTAPCSPACPTRSSASPTASPSSTPRSSTRRPTPTGPWCRREGSCRARWSPSSGWGRSGSSPSRWPASPGRLGDHRHRAVGRHQAVRDRPHPRRDPLHPRGPGGRGRHRPGADRRRGARAGHRRGRPVRGAPAVLLHPAQHREVREDRVRPEAPGFSLNPLLDKGIQVRGHFGYDWVSWKNCIRLLAKGTLQIAPLITHTLPLSRWAGGLRAHPVEEGGQGRAQARLAIGPPIGERRPRRESHGSLTH